jgi:hypothetical protein
MNREKAPQVIAYGPGSGAFSGFFGIGGGFLIVPGLVASTGMPMLMAAGTSLIAVTAFGLTTAANYAFSGLVAVLHSPARFSPQPHQRTHVGGQTDGPIFPMATSGTIRESPNIAYRA